MAMEALAGPPVGFAATAGMGLGFRGLMDRAVVVLVVVDMAARMEVMYTRLCCFGVE